MAGLGLSPAGAAPFGSGTPVIAAAPPSDVPELANFLDPYSGDYVVADDGSIERMPINRHRVLMCVKTALGSAAGLTDIGLQLPQRMDQSFPQRARDAVIAALAIIGNDIHINDVIVETAPMGKAEITIDYTDLATGETDSLTL